MEMYDMAMRPSPPVFEAGHRIWWWRWRWRTKTRSVVACWRVNGLVEEEGSPDKCPSQPTYIYVLQNLLLVSFFSSSVHMIQKSDQFRLSNPNYKI